MSLCSKSSVGNIFLNYRHIYDADVFREDSTAYIHEVSNIPHSFFLLIKCIIRVFELHFFIFPVKHSLGCFYLN